ncbi:MAG: sulfatase [Phycisphaerales bacterium]|jgi:N-sulfoglucosamine sulfohydrolase|nr:sulfatase [Phycisphaerales bacterium]MBT7171823.1 sulfatase [Phycisphaerales bacterium]
MQRRHFLKTAGIVGTGLLASPLLSAQKPKNRPNILLAISDDQSWPHAGAYGCKFVNTPAFDYVAKQGALFHNAFAPAPQCSPTRASILTGRYPWQNGDAAVHGSSIPAELPLYTNLLDKAGYHVGMTGKGWGPGLFKGDNPAGKEYVPKKNNYTAAFRSFLKARKPDQPFCFWYGARQPHRNYKKGSGLKAGKSLRDVEVPKFLPDHKSIRSDFLDYGLEIDYFDTHLKQILAILKKSGELDNTLVVVTSDNGMPWSRAKANLYEYGLHMPLAICWGKNIPGGRNVNDMVSLIDFAPTFLEVAGVAVPNGMSGKSLLSLLKSPKSGLVEQCRDHVFASSERHTPYVRKDDVGYAARAVRTAEYLYIHNLKTDRWPEGDTFFGGGGSSARDLYIAQCTNPKIQPYIRLAWAKRPAEELYDIKADPDCIHNLAGKPDHKKAQKKLKTMLHETLVAQGDIRMAGNDRYDTLEYFKGAEWKRKRIHFLKEVENVHKTMESAGWKHGVVIAPQ